MFDEKFQAEIREKFVKDSMDQAWQTFCQCDFYTGVIDNVFAEMEKHSKMIAKYETEYAEIENGKDAHTVKSRERKTALNTEIAKLNGVIERAGPQIKELTGIRDKHYYQGQQFANMAEFAKTYTMKEAKPAETKVDDTANFGKIKNDK